MRRAVAYRSPGRRSRRVLQVGLPLTGLALVAAGLGADAVPAELKGQLRLGQAFEYDDNVGLNSSDKTSDWNSVSIIGARLSAASPTTTFDLDAYTNFIRYLDTDEANTNNQYVTANAKYQGRRGDLGLLLGFTRDTTLTDILDSSGGNRIDAQRQLTYRVRPSFDYMLTPLDSLTGYGEYRFRDYDDANRQDYDTGRASLGYRRQLSRRIAAGFNFVGGYVDTDSVNASFFSPQAAVSFQSGERLNLQAAAGPSIIWSETEVDVSDDSSKDSDRELGYSLDGLATYDVTDLTQLELSLTRSVEPSGNTAGSAVQMTRVSAEVSQKVANRLYAELDGVLQRQSGVGDSGFADRNVAYVQPQLRYELLRDLDLSLSYRFRYESFDEDDDDATSNTVLLRLDYRLPEVRGEW